MIENKKTALSVFLETGVAFHRTSFGATANAARRHGAESTICRWITSCWKAAGW
jgi:hypothetical protein